MGMKLENLQQLNNNMFKQQITKTKFDFTFRHLFFSVIYIAEQFPHELLFGCKTHNLFFVVSVDKNFTISTYLGDGYLDLLNALDLKSNNANRFSPNVFFGAFKDAIPTSTTNANNPTMNEMAAISRDVEESDKEYFLGWLSHDGIKSNPSRENLAKTRRICGYDEYQIFAKHKISSRWTGIEMQSKKYTPPRAP